MNRFSVEDEEKDFYCKRHGVALKKHRDPMSGDIVWTCPKDKCKFRKNEDGEKI